MSSKSPAPGQPTPPAAFDPWSSGTPAYRACLLGGMIFTFFGVVTLLIAVFTDSAGVRTTGFILTGAGLLAHLVGIGLRRAQAARILRERKNQS